MKMIFEAPATVWQEAFPLGNGRIGALMFGDGEAGGKLAGYLELRPNPGLEERLYGKYQYRDELLDDWSV